MDKWNVMVKSSRAAHEDFNNLSDDNAIMWAADKIDKLEKQLELAEGYILHADGSSYPQTGEIWDDYIKEKQNG